MEGAPGGGRVGLGPMFHAFFNKAHELLEQNTPFVMAVVVRAEKPTSGKPGDKALITADGTMYGWVGGSCSQPTVIREALKALKDGKNRFIRLSPDPTRLSPRDGLIDLPMTCFSGGTVEIYIEPQYPQPRLMVIGNLPIARTLVALGKVMNYDVVHVDPEGNFAAEAGQVVTDLTDIGRHIRPETYVVVATQGSYDEAALEYVLKANPCYVGLVSSRKRLEAVGDYLKAQGIGEAALKRIKAPAGLDIHAQQGDEIALSIFAEIVQLRRTSRTIDEGNSAAAEMPADPTTHSQAVHAASAVPGVGIAIDPVCHMEVDIATAKYMSVHDGTTYYFCAPGCKRSFDKEPETYLSVQHRS